MPRNTSMVCIRSHCSRLPDALQEDYCGGGLPTNPMPRVSLIGLIHIELESVVAAHCGT